MQGLITNRLLKPVATSAGTVHAPEKAFGEYSGEDIVALAYSAARKLDGRFSLRVIDEGSGGVTLAVATTAGVVTLGPFPFPMDVVVEAVDYVAREGNARDGL